MLYPSCMWFTFHVLYIILPYRHYAQSCPKEVLFIIVKGVNELKDTYTEKAKKHNKDFQTHCRRRQSFSWTCEGIFQITSASAQLDSRYLVEPNTYRKVRSIIYSSYLGCKKSCIYCTKHTLQPYFLMPKNHLS